MSYSAYAVSSTPYSVQTHGSHIANGVQLVPGAPGYQTVPVLLNLASAYLPGRQPYNIEIHGSHIVDGVQLIPGAQGYEQELAYKLWISLLTEAPPSSLTEAPSPPLPTISVLAATAELTITLNVAGTVALSVSGSLGVFSAGSTALNDQATVKEGFLTLSANGITSAATSQYVVLGTSGADNIDTRNDGTRVDYISGGVGDDLVFAGAGDDIVLGGEGNDTLRGDDGSDTLTGGAGLDVIDGGAGIDTVAYNDVILATSHGLSGIAGMAVNLSAGSISAATVASAMGGGIVIGGGNGVAGTALLSATAGYLSSSAAASSTGMVRDTLISIENVIGSDLRDYIVGSSGSDVLWGGSGNDYIQGGSGADTIDGGSGTDIFNFAANDSRSIGFDTVSVTNGDIFKGSGISSSRPVSAAGGTQILTNLSSTSNVITALTQAIIGPAADLTNNAYLVKIVDDQTSLDIDFSGWYFVFEYTGATRSIDSSDIVVKLLGVNENTAISYSSGVDILFSI